MITLVKLFIGRSDPLETQGATKYLSLPSRAKDLPHPCRNVCRCLKKTGLENIANVAALNVEGTLLKGVSVLKQPLMLLNPNTN